MVLRRRVVEPLRLAPVPFAPLRVERPAVVRFAELFVDELRLDRLVVLFFELLLREVLLFLSAKSNSSFEGLA